VRKYVKGKSGGYWQYYRISIAVNCRTAGTEIPAKVSRLTPANLGGLGSQEPKTKSLEIRKTKGITKLVVTVSGLSLSTIAVFTCVINDRFSHYPLSPLALRSLRLNESAVDRLQYD
jgi:hypothetical protein